jgi:two-component system cell cycle response regulator DivK
MSPEKATVLVIEDDENNTLVITELLNLIGVRKIYTAENGWDGLKIALTAPRVDLILLDIQLPKENGYLVLTQLRTISKLSKTCVVAVTANVMPADEQKARAAGFDGFIGKPIDFDRFPKQITSLLQGQMVWVVR